jgi:glutamate-1-semialdehyde 2,1-aminomutase
MWSTVPVCNYGDYKATDFGIGEAFWLLSRIHGIISPPGLNEQPLISLAHGPVQNDAFIVDFRESPTVIRGQKEKPLV